MKKLLFYSIVILLFAASCTTRKSFTHQRYTNLGHSKNHVKTESKHDYAVNKKDQPAEVVIAEPVLVNVPVVTKPAESYTESAPLTARANAKTNDSKTTSGFAKKPSLINSGISMVKRNFSKLSDQQVKKEQAKRGLLFGIISDLLSILILVIIVVLIVWLVLILV